MVPGLYKLFDEAIVNCRDHYTRQRTVPRETRVPVTRIDIEIDKVTGRFSFRNDGPGIPIQQHTEYGLWIPELIFGHLRTSSNYDKSKKKRTGGKNGVGIKVCFIWSVKGRIHIRCQGKSYTQTFSNNLNDISKPTVRGCKTKDSTLVEFTPDYERMGIQGLSDDMYGVSGKTSSRPSSGYR